MSVRTKLTIMFLAVALIPVVFVGSLTFHNYRRFLEADRISELQNIAAFKVDKIETYFAGLKADMAIAQSLYNIKRNLPVLTRLVNEPNNQDFLATQMMLAEQLQPMQSVLPGIVDMMLVTPKGKVVYANRPQHYSKDMINGPFDAEREAFSGGKDKIYLSDVYFDKAEDKRFEMLITAPATDFKGDFIGIIAFEVDMTAIYKLIEDETGLGNTGETLLGKKVGDQILFLNPLRHDPNAALKRVRSTENKWGIGIQQATLGKTGTGQFLDYRGKMVIGAWRYIPSLDWGLVAKIDTNEAYADLEALRKSVIIIMVLVFILAGIMAFSIARSISEPIKKLAQGAEIIGNRNLDYKIETIYLKDEIGLLSRAFNKMTENLKLTTASRDDLNKEIAERNQTELELRKHRQEQQIILDSVPAMIFYKDTENHFVRTNKAFEDAMGMSKREMEGKSLFDIYPSEQAEAYWKDDKEVIASRQAKMAIIEPLETKHGTKLLETSKVPYTNERGNVIGVIGFAVDITERKKAEDTIHQNMAELAQFNSLMSGREVRMIELKKEINDLCERLGQQKKYNLDFDKEQHE